MLKNIKSRSENMKECSLAPSYIFAQNLPRHGEIVGATSSVSGRLNTICGLPALPCFGTGVVACLPTTAGGEKRSCQGLFWSILASQFQPFRWTGKLAVSRLIAKAGGTGQQLRDGQNIKTEENLK